MQENGKPAPDATRHGPESDALAGGGAASNANAAVTPEKSAAPEYDAAVAFLRQLRPNGPWALSAIKPDGLITTITAQSDDVAASFVRTYKDASNIYYSV